MAGGGLILFIAGLALLVLGAEFVVRGASRLALSLGVAPLLLGLTVVSIGTSAPELAVGITASLQGSGSLAVGNIAGTNVFNILFILGLSALLRPLALHLQILKLELPVIIAATGLMTFFAWDGVLSPLEGGIMFTGAILYTIALVRMSRLEVADVQEEFWDMYGGDVSEGVEHKRVIRTRFIYGAVLLVGLAFSVFGANLLVDGAVGLAGAWASRRR